MYKSIIIAAVGVVACAGAASAQSVTGTVDIDGSVAERCLFTTPSAVISVGELALPAANPNAGKLDASKLDGESRTLSGWCNGTAAEMSVEADPLLNVDYTSAPPSGFVRRIDYTATATANGVDASDTSSTGGSGSGETVGIFVGDVVVELSGSSTAGNALLVAGDYEGEVRVTLNPVP